MSRAWHSDALIIDAVRSPIGRRNGMLSKVRGDERRDPPDVERLLADLRHAAHLHVLDLGRIEVVALDEGVHDLPGKLVGAERGECAVPPADRRADSVDDQRVFHSSKSRNPRSRAATSRARP